MQIIYLHPHFTTAGGAGRAVLETGMRLAERGHDVHCVCIVADRDVVGEASAAIRFHEIGGPLSSSLLFWMRLRSSCERVRRVVEELGNSRPDSVLFPQVFPANWWAASVLRHHPEVRCVWYCQEPSAFIHSPAWIAALPWPKNWIARTLRPLFVSLDVKRCRQFSTVLVNSDFSSECTRRIYGYEPEQCETVYLGVNHEQFTRAVECRRPMDITTVAKLTRFKNVDKIIKAVGLLVEQGRSELRLNIVGDGDASRELMQLSGNLGLSDRVVFHGRVSDEKIARLLQRSMVFCLASVEEPFGLVTLESLACGTPVVAVNSGGPREVLAGQGCGILVGDADPRKIAEAIAQIFDSDSDFDTMSAAGVRRAAQFGWDATADRLEQVFESKRAICESGDVA